MVAKVVQSRPPETNPTQGDAAIKKTRKWKRETLFARKCRFLNKNPENRTAMTPSRVTRLFKRQTEALLESPNQAGIYAEELHSVQRISKRSSELLAHVLEKRLSQICKALRQNAKHAGRKTVKLEDFNLLMSQTRTTSGVIA